MAVILYEDEAVLVVKKPPGVESQRGRSFSMDLESELRNMLSYRQRKSSFEAMRQHTSGAEAGGVPPAGKDAFPACSEG